MLLIANHKSFQVDKYTTISMSMYEIGKFIVYMFTIHCMVYGKLLLQVYKFIVHQIVYIKLFLLTRH